MLHRLLLAALLLAGPAAAGAPPDPARVELLPGWRTPSGTHMAALRITLAPGWKTYWRAPGEAGIPPRFDWRGSENLAGVRVHWPVPIVFQLGDYRTIGYRDAVTLPLEVTPAQAGAPVTLAGEVELGVCETICVPLTVRLDADLPAAARRPDAAIEAALGDRPTSAEAAGLPSARCATAPLRDGLRLTASLELPRVPADPTVVVELDAPGVWVSPAEIRREGGTLVAVADLVPAAAAPFALDRRAVRLTLLEGGRAIEFRGCRG